MNGTDSCFHRVERCAGIRSARLPAGLGPKQASKTIVFKLLGVMVALYVVHALSVGEVYAKRGVSGATSKRGEEPFRYWSTIVVYAILSIALMLVF